MWDKYLNHDTNIDHGKILNLKHYYGENNLPL